MKTTLILLLFLLLCIRATSTKFLCTCESVDEPVPRPTPTPTPAPTPVSTANASVSPVVRPVNDSHPDSGIRRPLRCVSIYGLETNLRNTVCSWKRPAGYYLQKLHDSGFNTIRVPVSLQYIVEANFQVLDDLFIECAKLDISVLLDFHRVSNNRQEESWDKGIQEYGAIHSRQEFLHAVISIVGRYERFRQFVGLNSWNEFTGTNIQFKKDWDKFVFDEVEESFPGRFYYFPSGTFWASTLEGYSLEDLPYANRIVYAVHKYHWSGTGDRSDWERTFGSLYPPSKLLIGEYGFRDPEDMEWGKRFVDYLVEKNISNHCFWTIAHSGDTGGLWKDDCETFNDKKMDVLRPLFNTSVHASR